MSPPADGLLDGGVDLVLGWSGRLGRVSLEGSLTVVGVAEALLALEAVAALSLRLSLGTPLVTALVQPDGLQ